MKSTSYFCDRCGARKDGHPSVNITMKNGTEIRDVGWIVVNCKTGYKQEIDLCKNCLEDLRDWYKSKQTTETGDSID